MLEPKHCIMSLFSICMLTHLVLESVSYSSAQDLWLSASFYIFTARKKLFIFYHHIIISNQILKNSFQFVFSHLDAIVCFTSVVVSGTQHNIFTYLNVSYFMTKLSANQNRPCLSFESFFLPLRHEKDRQYAFLITWLARFNCQANLCHGLFPPFSLKILSTTPFIPK